MIPLKSWLKICYRLKKKKRLRKFVTVRGVLEGKKKNLRRKFERGMFDLYRDGE